MIWSGNIHRGVVYGITHSTMVVYSPVMRNYNCVIPIIQDSDCLRMCIFQTNRVSKVSNHDIPHTDIPMKDAEVISTINT